MRQLSEAVVNKLPLKAAAELEASHWRNLVPPEPWSDAVGSNAGAAARWAKRRLRTGAHLSRSVTIAARKPHQAIRPVPVVAADDRIILRALTDAVLADIPQPARSFADYQAFIQGPAHHALAGRTTLGFKAMRDDYVVQADIAAFYQYIDHDILRDELIVQTGKVEEVGALIEGLGEVQGKRFGLPQLYDFSDRLSEVYIQILVRDLRRRGLPVWHYNDDFRIAVQGYDRALAVIEEMSLAAADLGLILNETKTHISKYMTYFFAHGWTTSGDAEGLFSVDSIVEETDNDYDPTGQQRVDDAIEAFAQLHVDHEHQIELTKATAKQVRRLRSAIKALAYAADPAALAYVPDLLRFTPELTPRACEYLVALRSASPADVLETWMESIKFDGGFNAWQRQWLVWAARESNLLSDSHQVIEWVAQQWRIDAPHSLRTEAAVALATVGAVQFADLEQWLRNAPTPLVSWVLTAVGSLPEKPAPAFRALQGESAWWKMLSEGGERS